MNGDEHYINHWDMIIAHPPCTYLTNASSVRMRVKGVIQEERYSNAMKAKEFFLKFLNADCERICVENPVPMKLVDLPAYSQIIEPWQFGEPWKKKTCLWLRGLPKTASNTDYHGRNSALGEWWEQRFKRKLQTV